MKIVERRKEGFGRRGILWSHVFRDQKTEREESAKRTAAYAELHARRPVLDWKVLRARVRNLKLACRVLGHKWGPPQVHITLRLRYRVCERSECGRMRVA